MKTNHKLLVQFVAAVCMLSCFTYWGWGTAPCEAVTIKGKTLPQITDIIKTATGSPFSELPKHSILLYERFSNGAGGTRYQPRIFTVSPDGSVRKQYELEAHDVGLKIDEFRWYTQKMSLAMSDKRFGQRRTIMQTTPGMQDGHNVYGFRTLESNGTEDNANISEVPKKDSETATLYDKERNIWDNAHMTIKGFNDKDVFVYIQGPAVHQTGNLYFRFFTSDRNETGTVDWHKLNIQDGTDDGWMALGYEREPAIDITVGDFDGDGWKNEIAVCFGTVFRAVAYFYRVSKVDDNTVRVESIYTHDLSKKNYGGNASLNFSSIAALTGDFDGDGQQEAAFVHRFAYDQFFIYGDVSWVTIVKYDRNSGQWRSEREQTALRRYYEGFKATVADLEGDGKDEIVVLYFLREKKQSESLPSIRCWQCDFGQIKPTSFYAKGGVSDFGRTDTSVLGGYVDTPINYQYDSLTNQYQICEEFSITAGPVTGTPGKLKLADDIVISHINADASKVFVIPTRLDGKKFASFGDAKKIYEVVARDGSRRGTVITADFANEGLLLDTPKHTVDALDQSYGAVIQAMPYHVDNVDIYGNITPDPINYTFSGFNGDEGNGKMTIRYTKSDTQSTQNDVSFVMASTTETISLLGDVWQGVVDGLQFVNAVANIAGNFDPKAKSASDVMSNLMGVFLDRVDETTNTSTKEVKQFFTSTTMEAQLWDELLLYTAPQHIWRYKILSDPLPSWYQFGQKADYSSGNLKADKKIHYLTFSIYDDVKHPVTDSHALLEKQNNPTSMLASQNNTYQARHEEGNFFSYPSFPDNSEGYNPSGLLDNEDTHITWTTGSPVSKTIRFVQSKINSLKYEDNIQPSFLTKTISAIAALFGADDPSPLPPYSSHSETFQKSFSTSEQIDIELQGRSTLPGDEAGHEILVRPFVAREGTMNIATAVQLIQGPSSRLWGANSLYTKLPDPALVLPSKYKHVGATIRTNDNYASAMQMRGARFYVPALDLYSNNNLLAGLTYKIRIPVYNASFKDANNFDVRLYYAPANDFDVVHPDRSKTLQVIQNVNMSLGAWDNSNSDNNKGWAEFTWTVPTNLETGIYRFYVRIDPDYKMLEVHDSRLNPDGSSRDVGGNNEGYFSFVITSVKDAVNSMRQRSALTSSGFNAANKSLPEDGVIFRSVYPGEQAAKKEDSVKAALEIADDSGKVAVDITFENLSRDEDNITFYMLLGMLAEGVGLSEDTSLPVNCTLTYDGDDYYSEAYLYGVNFREGVLNSISDDADMDDIRGNTYLVHRIALVPHTTTNFVLNIAPRRIDWRNGSALEVYVPEIAGAAIRAQIAETERAEAEADDTDGGDDSGGGGDADPVPGDPGSSSGGCEVFGGSFALLGLAGMALLLTRKHR